jgi:outer membrane protein assembly factor BamB
LYTFWDREEYVTAFNRYPYWAFLFCLGFASIASADEWPQWMGPQRDNVWREDGLIDRFPEGGPKVLWRTPVENGYAGPAVAQGKVFVSDFATEQNVKVDNFAGKSFSGTERHFCLDESTGKEVWKHELSVTYSMSYPSGPRCTPTVDGDRVYFLGGEGNLFCVEIASGKLLWSKDLKSDYNTKSALWGYAAHPLIDGDKLITLAGGAGSHVVALDKLTGKEIWKSLTSKDQGYSPPTIIEAGGVRQLILLRTDAVTSVDPETGKEYWSLPYAASSGCIIMSPIKLGDYLYAAGYSSKSLLVKLDSSKPAATEVWRDKARSAISPVNVQPYAEDNVIYGMDQKGTMMALEIPSGNRLWESSVAIDGKRTTGSETAFIVRQGDRFWLFNEQGDLIIAKMNRDGFEELDRAHVIEASNNSDGRKVVWSMPAFANRRAFIRNDKEIICLDLAK